jgi:uncharacterized protein GlcG (DUF336 family)
VNKAATISVQDATRALSAARSQAEELGTEVCVVVVDAGGNLKALIRDGIPARVPRIRDRKGWRSP